MNNQQQPMNVGIVGLAGFSLAHHSAVQRLESEGLCRLVCTTDHGAERERERVAGLRLAERGVRVFGDFNDMLERCGGNLQLLIVPTPIHLHKPMHRACVERGIPCYLEKPPTLMVDELAAMLDVESRAKLATYVGFNFIREPQRLVLKRRLLDGEFGGLVRGSYLGLWSRSESYYRRTSWAGKLFAGVYPVLDSCLGNAMAHLVFNMLFWCGTGEVLSWGEIAAVSAELYRANSIESTDTMFAVAQLANGVELSFAASHACEDGFIAEERLECTEAVIAYGVGGGYQIAWKDGRRETGEATPADATTENLRGYLAYLRGETARPLIRLVDTKSFVEFYNLLFIAAGHITTLPRAALRIIVPGDANDRLVTIPGIREIAHTMAETGEFPSAQCLAWARPGGRATKAQLPELFEKLDEFRGK